MLRPLDKETVRSHLLSRDTTVGKRLGRSYQQRGTMTCTRQNKKFDEGASNTFPRSGNHGNMFTRSGYHGNTMISLGSPPSRTPLIPPPCTCICMRHKFLSSLSPHNVHLQSVPPLQLHAVKLRWAYDVCSVHWQCTVRPMSTPPLPCHSDAGIYRNHELPNHSSRISRKIWKANVSPSLSVVCVLSNVCVRFLPCCPCGTILCYYTVMSQF